MIVFDVSDLVNWYRTRTHVTGICRVVETILTHILEKTNDITCVFRVGRGEKFYIIDNQLIKSLKNFSHNSVPSRLEAIKALNELFYTVHTVQNSKNFWTKGWRTPLMFLLILISYPFRRRAFAKIADLTRVARLQQFIPSANDTMVILGSFWGKRRDHELYKNIREKINPKIVICIYDLLPIAFPAFCAPKTREQFVPAMATMTALSDAFILSSQSVHDAVTTYMAERNIAMKPVFKMEYGFGLPYGTAEGTIPAIETVFTSRNIAAPESYILCVGTLEPRKNGLFLLHCWQRLLARSDAPKPFPKLVFAGRKGWLIDDFFEHLESDPRLKREVILLEGPDDMELAALYQGARFCVYPSLAEGWGLPASESSAYGKLCFAAISPGVTEAGRGLNILFDPKSHEDFLNKAFPYMIDDRLLAEKEQEIITGSAELKVKFTWQKAADQLMDDLRKMNQK